MLLYATKFIVTFYSCNRPNAGQNYKKETSIKTRHSSLCRGTKSPKLGQAAGDRKKPAVGAACWTMSRLDRSQAMQGFMRQNGVLSV